MLRGSGEVRAMEFGMMHFVDPDERRSKHAGTDLHQLSIVCPALRGDEQHDTEGTLATTGPVPSGREGP